MIREFKSSDTEIIMQIWLQENINAHSFISRQYWEDHYDYVKSILPNAQIYVYTESNGILGFLGMNGCYIEGLFIKSEMQNKGLGTALLNTAKQKNSKLTLSVYKNNIKAIGFYHKNGFSIIEENTDTNTHEKQYIMMWEKEK